MSDKRNRIEALHGDFGEMLEDVIKKYLTTERGTIFDTQVNKAAQELYEKIRGSQLNVNLLGRIFEAYVRKPFSKEENTESKLKFAKAVISRVLELVQTAPNSNLES